MAMASFVMSGPSKRSASPLDASDRKKRTRPVSACEHCRSKKIKCNLLPDRPVCVNCEQSGKQCLFRVDDLSPALRRERFSEYGEPIKPDGPTHSNRRRKSRRKSSSATEGANGEYGNDGADGREAQGSDARSAKAKAVFRSFANPNKLAAPSVPNSSSTTSDSYQYLQSPASDKTHSSETAGKKSTASSIEPLPASGAAHRSGTSHSSWMQPWLAQPYAAADSRQSPQTNSGRSSRRNTFDSYWTLSNAQLPSSELDSPSLPLGVVEDMSYVNGSRSQAPQSSFPHTLSRSHQHRSYSDAAVVGVAAINPPASFPQISNAVISRPEDALSRRPESSLHPSASEIEYSLQDQGSDLNSAINVYRDRLDTQHSRGAQAPTLDMLSDAAARATTSRSTHRLERPSYTHSRSGILQQSYSSNRPNGDMRANASFDNKSSAFLNSSPGSRISGAGSNASTTAPSRPPTTFKKIALPFFRWFGATANTPGIKRIKVGVYHDAENESVKGDNVFDDEEAKIDLQSPETVNGEEKQDTSSMHFQSKLAATPVNAHETMSTPHSFLALSSSERADAPPAANLQGADQTVSSSTRELFETERPRYPRREILVHLTELFLKCFKASCFPWLDSGELMSSAESGELPAILANAICALTARFSNRAELQGVKNPSESFSDMSKILIVPMLSWPSIDVIEALIVLSYVEFAAGADAGLWMYIGMALRMATDLGLQHELTIQSMSSQRQKDRARYIFWSIVSLDRITCFGTGRPVTMRDDAYDCALPPLSTDEHSDAYVFNHIIRLLLHRGQIGELLNRREEGQSREDRSARLQVLWKDLASYNEQLPRELHFGITSFRKMAALDMGPAFVYLHVLLQSTISLINRPSLLRRFDKDFNASAPTDLAQIANHASATIASILRFASDAGQHGLNIATNLSTVNLFIDCNPFLDQLILPAGRALLTERESASDALRQQNLDGQISLDSTSKTDTQALNGDGGNNRQNEIIARRQYADLHLNSCQQVLDRIAKWWLGAAWPARALQQETVGALGVEAGPDGTDDDAQPAPIRDVEMVLKWAKARRQRASLELTTPDRRAGEFSQAVGKSLQQGNLQEGDGGTSRFQQSWARSGDDGGAQEASSLGLGISGSMGAESHIDVDALIDAWARELDGVDSSAAWVPDLPMTAHSRGHTAQAGLNSGSLSRITDTPSNAAVNSVPQHAASQASLTARNPAASWSDPTSNLIDFNFNGMQLEEFIFESSEKRNGAMNAHDHQGQLTDTASGGNDAMTRSTQFDGASDHSQQLADASAASNGMLGQGSFGDQQQSASLNTFITERDLQMLPSVLLNAFTIAPSPYSGGHTQ